MLHLTHLILRLPKSYLHSLKLLLTGGCSLPDVLSISRRGLVPSQHTAGASFKKSSMKVGQKVAVRVLACDAPNRRLTLTMKKLLLEEKLAPFTSWEVRLHCSEQALLDVTPCKVSPPMPELATPLALR